MKPGVTLVPNTRDDGTVQQSISLAVRDSRTCVPSISIWPQRNVSDIAPVIPPSLESHPGLIVNPIPSLATRPDSSSFIVYSFVHKTYSQFATTDDFLHTP